MGKDWTGNRNSVFKTLAASNHSQSERQPEDYYATEPRAAELLLENETFDGPIWECACGEKHLSQVFENWGGVRRQKFRPVRPLRQRSVRLPLAGEYALERKHRHQPTLQVRTRLCV